MILLSIHFSISYFSPRNQRDEVDAGISNLVFDVNNKDRPPWRCCSNSTVPMSEVIFRSSEYRCLNDPSLLFYALSIIRKL